MAFVNPYQVLRVSPAASHQEITKAFMQAMKRKEYSVEAIANARKSLMNPSERVIADYLQPILPPIQRFQRGDYSLLETPLPDLNLLPEFSRLKNYVDDYNSKALRAKLGELLFNEEP